VRYDYGTEKKGTETPPAGLLSRRSLWCSVSLFRRGREPAEFEDLPRQPSESVGNERPSFQLEMETSALLGFWFPRGFLGLAATLEVIATESSADT